MFLNRALFLVLLLLLAPATPALAQHEPSEPPVREQADSREDAARENVSQEEASEEEEAAAEGVTETPTARLPGASVTRHELALEDRTLRFSVMAGALTLTDDKNRPQADIGFVAYTRESDDPTGRPVTFAVNGGPGAASAYLHIGVLGPWRLPMGVDNIVPSQAIDLEANAETWLDFTDLVFIDPVGTGFSRLVDASDQVRNRYLSVDGDIEALSDFVFRWLNQNGRMRSPKYFVGESYGGFRGPLLADKLQTDYGVALSGMTLLSPVLDFGWREQPAYAPLPKVSLLPSLAAAAMEKGGEFSLAQLRAAEDYAAGEFVVELLRGLQDEEAVARIISRVAEITGLEERIVADHAGRLDMRAFARELFRGDQRIASLYDTGVTGDDPTPEQPFSRAGDPVLDAMTAPLTSGMLALYRETFQWLPERRYILLNSGVSRAWRWGGGRSQPEAVSALRRVLALDSEFRVLVVHGYTDLVTPYFESELILRQLRDFDGRVRLANYRGGHMFYTRGDSRRAFMEDAMWMYGGRTTPP